MPQPTPAPLRFVHSGSVGDTLRELGRPDFIDRCRSRYLSMGFGEPGASEVESWRKSWPPLLDALARAGLHELRIYLEFGTPEGHSRFDALLIGERGPKDLVAVVVELKQWTEAETLTHDRVRLRLDGSTRTHPVAQVAGYTSFLRLWFGSDELDLDVRGLVFLHNADEEQAEVFRGLSRADYGCPVLSGTQVSEEASPEGLRALFRLDDARGATERLVKSFETSSWRPNRELLSMVADVIERNPSFVLMGDQQDALLEIRAKIDEARATGRRSIVLVQGRPGSGKTALAMRLLGSYTKEGRNSARYLTPSGTLNSNLREATKNVRGSQDLFGQPRHVVSEADLVIIDEAHRFPRTGTPFDTYVGYHLRRVPVVVVFLDERQRIRPKEGLQKWEVHRLGEREQERIEVVSHELRGSFRCNGSRRFVTWVDSLLYGEPHPWQGMDYDVDVVDNPSEMERWMRECLEQERKARISAGYCWSWSSPAPGLDLPGVSIEWKDPHTGRTHHWARPWNLHDQRERPNGEVEFPKSQFWATHPGGVEQIGCVYTAQGLEYDDAGVILGPDLVRRNGQWVADPGESRDPHMRSVGREEYFDLARNIYRVLMTRGMGSCRLYSTDRETQEFLTSLVHGA
ncbi:DNA/RNA helicase domain-containing protein [Nocardiopsis lucentensis]|uniref:DNA/RNA helicase domain-containing protein n=1 Tax=Nocardiopsis lucentensis TaxID=53441 RepID=UPI000346DFAB|nr:DNA/RNA helicase domain-containing protein [Nocardiopsis lucentensis]